MKANRHHVTTSGLIQIAWHLDPYRVSGGPDWIASEGYDVDAYTAANAIAPGAPWTGKGFTRWR